MTVTEDRAVAVTAKDRIETLHRLMDNEAGIPDVTDSKDIRYSIQAKVLDAVDDDDVLDAGNAGLTSVDAIIGVPLRIYGYRFNRSTIQDSELPVYAAIEAVDSDGQILTIGCGAETVLTQLFRLEQIRSFAERDGFLCAFAEKQTASGNMVRSLRKLTKAEANLFS